MEGLGVTRSEQPVARLLPVWRDGKYDHLAFLFAIYNRERKALTLVFRVPAGPGAPPLGNRTIRANDAFTDSRKRLPVPSRLPS